MAHPTKADLAQRQGLFLEAFAQCGNITESARLVGLERSSHYKWLANDPDYPAKFKDAFEQACDKLEHEAWRRGVEGWDEPVFQGGQEVGVIRRYDSGLLKALLRAHLPNRYGQEVKHEHEGGVKVVVEYVDVARDQG